jgi:hypothetical protein
MSTFRKYLFGFTYKVLITDDREDKIDARRMKHFVQVP